MKTDPFRTLSKLLAVMITGLSVTAIVGAHIDYVYEQELQTTTMELIRTALAGPEAALLVIVPVVMIGLLVTIQRSGVIEQDIAMVEAALAEDRSFVPLILRLSMGVPLIGAGFQGYLFTPAVPFQNRVLLVTLGFTLIFGLATRFIAGITLLLYLVMLPSHHDLLLAFEFIPGLCAILILGSGRPSIDQLLTELSRHDNTLYGRIDPVYGHVVKPFAAFIDPYRPYVPLIIRGGLGIALIYLGIVQKLLRPGVALSVVEKYSLTALVPVSPELWVLGAAIAETVVGVWLILGIWTRLAGAVLFFLFSLTLFGLPDDPVLPHTSLFGLIAVLLIVGGGTRTEEEQEQEGSEET